MLTIYWNLKNPINLSFLNETNNLNMEYSQIHTTFKATSIKDLNDKRKQQISLDDFSLKMNEKVDDIPINRAQTVKCKSNKWKRSVLTMENDTKVDLKFCKKSNHFF